MILLLLGVFSLFLLVSGLGGLLVHPGPKGKLDENSLPVLLLLTMSLHGSVLLATGLLLWRLHISWKQAFGFSRRHLGRVLALGALLGVVFYPVGYWLQVLSAVAWKLLHRQQEMPVQEAVETLKSLQSASTQVYFCFFSIILAPLAEEILFRGVLYGWIRQLGLRGLGMWVSAIAFAAIHMNLPIFLPLLALGLALALLYEWTDNLLAPIAAHGVFNAINIMLFYGFPASSPGSH